jgi:hypothetical protein
LRCWRSSSSGSPIPRIRDTSCQRPRQAIRPLTARRRLPSAAAADRGPAIGSCASAPRGAAPDSRKGRGGLSREQWPSLGRAVHSSPEGNARLSTEHTTAPRRAAPDSSKSTWHLREGLAQTLRRSATIPRESCVHLHGEHRCPDRRAPGCSRDGTSQLPTEHRRPARRAPDRSRGGRGLLSRWRRPLPQSVASGSGLQAS